MVEIEHFSKRLETPRPPRKVTLKKNWQCQQQQHSTSGTDVSSFRQKREEVPEVQDDSKHIPEVDQAPGNWEQSISTKDEIHTDDVDVTTDNQIIERILHRFKQNFVFVKIWRRRTWYSGKSPVKSSKTWWTLSSSNWGLLKFNVPHAVMPYSRWPFFAHVVGIFDRTRRGHTTYWGSFSDSQLTLFPHVFRLSSRGHKHGHQLWQLPAAEAKCLWICLFCGRNIN